MSTAADSDSIHYATVHDLAPLIRAGALSPAELTERILARIEALDPVLGAYRTVCADSAMEAARMATGEISRGRYLGPLHGIPVAVKDNLYTAGVRTTAGLGVLRDFVPDHDAAVVARLRRAGAVLLGKLNLTEGALAAYHPNARVAVNPWDGSAWAGISSGGPAVATAAGLCFAAIATDSGGSIRLPSAANGVVGLKPTFGMVSRHGTVPLSGTLDHTGPVCRSVRDTATVLQAIAGPDGRDRATLGVTVPRFGSGIHGGIRGHRIGIDREYALAKIDPSLRRAVESALDVFRSLGAEILEMRVPDGIRRCGRSWTTICAFEACAAHAHWYPRRASDYGPYLRGMLELGRATSQASYQRALRQRAQLAAEFSTGLAGFDAIVCPAANATPDIESIDQHGDAAALAPILRNAGFRFTLPANLAGIPSLTVPCGFSDRGLPCGLQLLGPAQSEPVLCRIGSAFQRATDWHQRHPPV